MEINKILEFIINNEGSDIILTVGAAPSIRVHGDVKAISKKPLTKEDTLGFFEQIAQPKFVKELKEDLTTDFAYRYSEDATFRVSAFYQQECVALVMRIIPSKLIPFEQLGLPKMVLQEALRPRGLFLVTGPTGSGKSTTIATIIDFINSNSEKHIITVEDPIEFRHKHKRSIVTHREVGVDVPTFPEALKRALRQDPDVILIGELRDLDSISIALSAAETGHLVMGTLHTNSAYDTITRIVDAFPTNQQDMVRTQIAGSLNLILCQTLCKKIDGGRVPAYEIMKVNTGMRNQIRENKIHQIPSSIQISRGEGNMLFDDYLFGLYTSGKAKFESVAEKCKDPKALSNKIKEWKEEQAKLQGKKPGMKERPKKAKKPPE
jgi:twitching motility protein PilT